MRHRVNEWACEWTNGDDNKIYDEGIGNKFYELIMLFWVTSCEPQNVKDDEFLALNLC